MKLLIFLLFSLPCFAQQTTFSLLKVGDRSPIAPSASLEIKSTTSGFLLPRMTTTQKNAISSPAAGLTVYDTNLNTLSVYNGASWATAGGASGVGSLDGAADSINGLVISGSTLYAQSANTLYPGLINNNSQSFSGIKTFTSNPIFSNISTGGVLLIASGGTVSSSSGPLSISNGGSNSSVSLNNNRVMVSSGGTIGELNFSGSSGQFLTSNGTSNLPSFQTYTPSAGSLTGTVPIVNGGTNSNVSLNNNRIVVSSGGTIGELNFGGTSGLVLTSNGTSSLPTWQTTSGSGVTSYIWSGYHNSINGNSWSRGAATWGDFTNADSSITLFQANNTNFGTVTGYGASIGSSALPGIVFTPPVAGLYHIKASLPVNGNLASAQFVSVRLWDSTGSTVIDASPVIYFASQTIFPVTMSGIVNCGTTASRTITIQGESASSGTFYIDNAVRGGAQGGHSIDWELYLIH